MTKSTLTKCLFLLFLCALLTFSLLLSSCSLSKTNDERLASTLNTYENKIIILENELSHLKNDYVNLDAEKTAEIDKLRAEIQKLKEEIKVGATDDNENEEETKKSDFTYKVKDGTAIITGYVGQETAIVIPSTIDGYTVTEIGDDAFKTTKITSVSIPSTVTVIGWFAFTDCISLTAAVIPESVKSIGYEAFSGCKSLTVYAIRDSYAAKYAKSYGITVSVE
jgi:hypothetical protein